MAMIDARELPADSVTRSDICIIGSGPAGLTVARELADLTLDIVVLEGGGETYTPDSQEFYRGEVTGEPYRDLAASRLRFLGGSSNHWNGYCRPLDRHDLSERPWVRYSGWPISLDELDSAYRRAQGICELGPWQYDGQTWARKGSFSTLSDGPTSQTTVLQLSPPTRFGERYGRPLAHADLVDIHVNATAVLIERDPGSGHVTSVVTAEIDGTLRRYEAEWFILALGGLENPRLLLASGGIGNENDLVGRFFMEHPHVSVGYLQGTTAEELPFLVQDEHEVDGTRLRALLTLSSDFQTAEGLLNCAVALRPSTNDESNMVLNDPLHGPVTQMMAGLQGKDIRDTTTIRAVAEQQPNPRSRVMLSRSEDALGQPRVRLHWQLTSEDHLSIRRTTELIASELSQHGLGRAHLAWPYPSRDIIGGNHHMGTTRMHPDPQRGVVDENCRIHGTPNLYVAGSSVFPTGGFANPTLTLVAMAVRLAEHLRTIL